MEVANAKVQQVVKVVNPEGLHMRVALLISDFAKRYPDTEVMVTKTGETVNGKEILQLLTLGAVQGTDLLLETAGGHADLVLAVLVKMFDRGFRDVEQLQDTQCDLVDAGT